MREVGSPHCRSKNIVSRWTHRLPGSLNSRYKIPLKRIPSLCVCEAAFSLKHALSCPKTGFMSIKHNKVRDFTAELLSECCNNLNRACVTTTSRLKLYQRQEFSQMKFMSMLQGQVAYVSVRVLNPRARVYLT